MVETTDLRITEEIFNLFNYTHNKFSKNILKELLCLPLHNKGEIQLRQSILKGFIKNTNVLKEYSYSSIYFRNVYNFLTNEEIKSETNKIWSYKFYSSTSTRASHKSKFIQTILLFDRLNKICFANLDISLFPIEYAKEIQNIVAYLEFFELEKYMHLINENRFYDSHSLALAEKLSNLREKTTIFWDTFFLFEAYLSISIGLCKHGFIFPSFTRDELILKDFYHPLLENPVSNTIKSSKNVILLSGPNMSGKSTFIKSISICIYLAHLGVGIPAKAANIPFFKNFSITLNSKDDLKNGFSHFLNEVKTLKKIVIKANNEPCFAVFDELFSGTNSKDSLELLNKTIVGLAKYNDSLFFISTHIEELKAIKNNMVSNYQIECNMVDNTPFFTYKVKKGWSEIRIGKILFEKEGLFSLLN